jgi:uncharacterized protein with PIN domain
MKTVYVRFYEELNDFLPPDKRKLRFLHSFQGRVSIKDLLESFGVPHTEIDLILVNARSVGFNYIVNDKDDISVYPVFESFNITEVQHLRPQPLREPKFILDVQLGSLSKYLRMLGFDAAYKNSNSKNEIIMISINEKRTILTKDLNLLKRNDVTHGYWIRNKEVIEQVKEVSGRFQLNNLIQPFSRCMVCNTLLEGIEKKKIMERLQERTKNMVDEFETCPSCNRIYWKGSHYQKMEGIIDKIREFK